MGIDPTTPRNVGAFSIGQRGYLDYHRKEVFLSCSVWLK